MNLPNSYIARRCPTAPSDTGVPDPGNGCSGLRCHRFHHDNQHDNQPCLGPAGDRWHVESVHESRQAGLGSDHSNLQRHRAAGSSRQTGLVDCSAVDSLRQRCHFNPIELGLGGTVRQRWSVCRRAHISAIHLPSDARLWQFNLPTGSS